MTFKELLVETKDIDLNKIGIFLGERANVIDSVSCWEKENEWFIEIVDDRQQVYLLKGTEEYVVRKMRSHIKWRMRAEHKMLTFDLELGDIYKSKDQANKAN